MVQRKALLAAGVGAIASACAAGSVQAQAVTHFPSRVCDITRYAAPATGTRIAFDTDAIQKSIDDCAAAGGGTVRIPHGSWLSGPLFLKSNIRLQIDRGAELVAGTDDAMFRKTDATARFAPNSYVAFLNIADAENVAITGQGRVDGQGAVWWEKWRAEARRTGKRPGADRPRLLYAVRSRNVLIEGVNFFNSPSFHLVFKDADGVTIRGVHIQALAHSPNTDAMDPIDTRNVLIENNVVDTGDDVVAIKSAHVDPKHPGASSGNIVIRGNTVLAGRGISIGSESIGGVSHVLVENNTTSNAMYGIRIKTPRGRGGPVNDIVFRNNRMTDVGTPFVVSAYYTALPSEAEQQKIISGGGFLLNDQIYPAQDDPAQPLNKTPVISNVVIDGLTATGAEHDGVIAGLPEAPITGLQLRNISIQGDTGVVVRHAQVVFSGVQIKAKSGPPVIRQVGAKITTAPAAAKQRK